MFNHESFISIEKCLISIDLEVQNPCNEIGEENHTSEINKDIYVEKIDDFEEMFDFLLIKSIDLSFKMFSIHRAYQSKYLFRLGGIYSISEFALISSKKW